MIQEPHIVLLTVMDDNEVTVGQLARRSGCGESTIYKYRSGELPVPVFIWQCLYELTRDHKIPAIITGDVPVMTIDLPDEIDATDIEAMKHLAGVTGSNAECVQEFVKIFADGRVDAKDREAVLKLEELVPEAIRQLIQFKVSVRRQYENLRKQKK